MVLGNDLAQFKQQRMQLGLDFDPNSAGAQRAGEFGQFKQDAQPLIDQSQSDAQQRADTTFNQLKQAGLLNVANQFQRSQRNIAFDTARRGTLGGSRSTERLGEAQDVANNQVGGVIAGAQQASEAQRLQELAPTFGVQQQLASGDPFAQQITQNQLGSFQQQGNAALGQFDLGQSQNAITSAHGLNQAQNISGLLSGLGTGIFGLGAKVQDRNQATAIRKLGGGF